MISIGVIGSREFKYPDLVRTTVAALPVVFWTREFQVVSGGAKGVDTWASEEAISLGMNTKIVKASWDIYGKGAGMIRNKILVDQCDFLLIFWDGQSPGTKGAFKYARQQKVPYKIIGGWSAI